ncbi:Chromatin modification-related protein eaf6, partial [Trichoderma ghanense]
SQDPTLPLACFSCIIKSTSRNSDSIRQLDVAIAIASIFVRDKKRWRMADKKQATTSRPSEAQPTMAEYKKAQARVRDLVDRRRQLERRLAAMEESIMQKESAYLDSTPNGNIITGFDNYMKGTSGAAAQRRKTGPPEQNRVFSRSSISYRPNNGDSSTPGSVGSTPAPTPLSTTFRDSGSSNPTPTSAGGSKASKSKKKDTEESENDAQTNKKRTNFGASRK